VLRVFQKDDSKVVKSGILQVVTTVPVRADLLALKSADKMDYLMDDVKDLEWVEKRVY
jgi:hypothetical protein